MFDDNAIVYWWYTPTLQTVCGVQYQCRLSSWTIVVVHSRDDEEVGVAKITQKPASIFPDEAGKTIPNKLSECSQKLLQN